MFLLDKNLAQLVTYITVFTAILVLFQLFYWYYFFNGLSKFNAEVSSKSDAKPVSVVICARNAEKDLERHIPDILAQNYPEFEVLVIDDDSSEDNTAHLMKRMQQKERYLNYRKIIKNKLGKKEALAAGIVNSRHSWVLLTDADCLPKSKDWIKVMAAQAQKQNSDIVLGYSPYTNNGSLLNHWIHFEAWITGIQYLSYALKGMPYMGVGRNILYSKALLKPEVLKKHSDLVSGDDDLTVNQLATRENCCISIDKKSFVETTPVSSWSAYFKQKRRHFSTSHRYQLKHQFLLGMYSFSQIAFLVLLICLCTMGQFVLALMIMLIRLLLLLPAVSALMPKLNATFKLWMFPFLDLGQSIFYILFSFSVLVPQKNKW